MEQEKFTTMNLLDETAYKARGRIGNNITKFWQAYLDPLWNVTLMLYCQQLVRGYNASEIINCVTKQPGGLATILSHSFPS